MKKTEFLKEILKEKENETDILAVRGIEYLEKGITGLPPVVSLKQALLPSGMHIIAEVKKSSPSHGEILAEYNPAEIAGRYQDFGASAVSVLTCRKYFSGSLNDLATVRKVVDLPLLRKDFIISPLQVFESRIAGADAVLFIVSILKKQQLESLYKAANETGLEVLLEVHSEKELDLALEFNPEIIGINSRDLGTFEVDKKIFEKLVKRIPDGIISIAESGIENTDEIPLLKNMGFSAILTGYMLLKSGSAVRDKFTELRGGLR